MATLIVCDMECVLIIQVTKCPTDANIKLPTERSTDLIRRTSGQYAKRVDMGSIIHGSGDAKQQAVPRPNWEELALNFWPK